MCYVCSASEAALDAGPGGMLINNTTKKMVVNISSSHISTQFSVLTQLKSWHLPIPNVSEKGEKFVKSCKSIHHPAQSQIYFQLAFV